MSYRDSAEWLTVYAVMWSQRSHLCRPVPGSQVRYSPLQVAEACATEADDAVAALALLRAADGDRALAALRNRKDPND